MQHLFSAPSEEEAHKRRHSHRMEKFEALSKMQRSDSVRSLVALAAQIPRHKYFQSEEDDIDGGVASDLDGGVGSGYWSSPEDHMFMSEQRNRDEDATSEPSASPAGERLSTVTAWSDSEIQ